MTPGNMGFLNTDVWAKLRDPQLLNPPGRRSSAVSYWFLSIRSGRRNMSKAVGRKVANQVAATTEHRQPGAR
ncbi:hypothetical protein MY11210_002658 [Beauveria gryllotalpidicola]